MSSIPSKAYPELDKELESLIQYISPGSKANGSPNPRPFNAWIFKKIAKLENDSDIVHSSSQFELAYNANPLPRVVDDLSRFNVFFHTPLKSSDPQAYSIYKRVCPVLGFSIWTGYFLIGQEMGNSRHSMTILSSKVKKYLNQTSEFRIGAGVDVNESAQGKVSPPHRVPPDITIEFLCSLENARLARDDGDSSVWEPGVLFLYKPKHVEKAVEVFEKHSIPNDQGTDQVVCPQRDHRTKDVANEHQSDTEPEIRRNYSPLEQDTPAWEPDNFNNGQNEDRMSQSQSPLIFGSAPHIDAALSFNLSALETDLDPTKNAQCTLLSHKVTAIKKRRSISGDSFYHNGDDSVSRSSSRRKVDIKNFTPIPGDTPDSLFPDVSKILP
ncbi:hypothetical protein F4679DRAFT_591305 [Xylaria curta]|nr:hypothetical protein F4679DRAFT_591305 [Xylaria curta]